MKYDQRQFSPVKVTECFFYFQIDPEVFVGNMAVLTFCKYFQKIRVFIVIACILLSIQFILAYSFYSINKDEFGVIKEVQQRIETLETVHKKRNGRDHERKNDLASDFAAGKVRF